MNKEKDITEYKKIELSLKESERKYRTLFKTSTEGILIAETETHKFKYANPAICQMLGYSQKELATMGITDIHKKEDLQHILAVFQDLIRRKYFVGTDIPCLKKDGTIFYADITSAPIVIDGHKCTAGFFRDTTKRKKAEQEIISISKFHEESPSPIGRTDSNGKLLYCNHSCNKKFTCKSIKPKLKNIIKKMVAENSFKPEDVELVIDNKTFLFTVVSIKGQNYVNFYGKDITELKESQKNLKENSLLLQDVSKIANIGGWTFNPETLNQAWTDETFRILEIDLKKGELKVPEGLEFVASEYRPMAEQAVQRAISFGEPYDQEWEIITAKGNKRWVRAIAKIKKEQGKVKNIYGSFQDITEKKEAEEDLKQSYIKAKKTLGQIINTMAHIIEVKDPYTSGHQKNVARIAVEIAKKLGFSDDTIEAINIASIIHDIGKITIQASILSKPGKLSEIEFAMIKDHSKTGSDILKEIDFGYPVSEIVLQHHERLDGSGYPSGLKDKDICIEARILAVADVVEAMSFHRPYRPSLGIDQALKEIEQKKAILYDSKVVDACSKLFRKDKFVL